MMGGLNVAGPGAGSVPPMPGMWRPPAPPSASTPGTGGSDTRSLVQAAVTYRNEIAQLIGMGFTDEEAVLQALIATGGNVEAAIDRLVSRGF